MQVTTEQLQDKIATMPNAWNKDRPNRVKSQHTNITQITDNILRFTEYNILPYHLQLDGHYRFYVNYKTFDWAVIQHAYWGSLTYTSEPKDDTILTKDNLDKDTIKFIESKIAHKLLGAHYVKFVAKKGWDKTDLFDSTFRQSKIYELDGELSETDKQMIKILSDI